MLYNTVLIYSLIYLFCQLSNREGELQEKRDALKQSEGSEVIKGDEVCLTDISLHIICLCLLYVGPNRQDCELNLILQLNPKINNFPKTVSSHFKCRKYFIT